MSTVPDQSNEGKSRSFLNIYQSKSFSSRHPQECCAADHFIQTANFEVLRRTQDAEGSD
jgi:hypothetical protein